MCPQSHVDSTDRRGGRESDGSERDRRMADLFESITGQSTIVERQEATNQRRLDEGGEERSIRRYVSAASAATGLDDAIDVPDSW